MKNSDYTITTKRKKFVKGYAYGRFRLIPSPNRTKKNFFTNKIFSEYAYTILVTYFIINFIFCTRHISIIDN